MIGKKIKNIFENQERKTILSNFLSLSFLQGVNMLLPLITFPYLVNVLGAEKYGLVLFAQSLITYFTLIVDYGFNLSGTREISLNRNKEAALGLTFNSIFFARILLCFVGLVIFSIVVFSFYRFSKNWELYFFTYGTVVGTALFPTWFFQGIEKMKYISILNFISKLLFTVLLFFIVKQPNDYFYVPVLISLGYIVSGLLSIYLIVVKFEVKIVYPPWIEIIKQLKIGWHIFLSKISTNFYTATTTFILGLATNNTVVGYYGIAEKVLRIIVSMFAPITQAFYPFMVKLAKDSKEQAKVYAQKLMIICIAFSFFLFLCVTFFTTPIFKLLFQGDILKSVQIFQVLSPLVIIIPLASVLFNVVMLSFELDKHFFRIYTIGAVLNVVLLYIFLFLMNLSAVGAAFSLLICELTITTLAGIILFKKNYLSSKLFKSIRLQ